MINNSPLPDPDTQAPAIAAVSSGRCATRRAGWLLAVITTVMVGVIVVIPTSSPGVGLFLISLVLLLALGMLIAAGLLIVGYHEFFGRARGVTLWGAIFLLSIYLNSEPTFLVRGPALSTIVTILSLWGIVAALAVGPSLLLYLIRTDRGVAAFAITYLLLVWMMFSLGQRLGWDVLLQRIISGTTGGFLWPFQGLLCGSIWVTIAATVAFIWNSAVYLKREREGVRLANDEPPSILAKGDATVQYSEEGDV